MWNDGNANKLFLVWLMCVFDVIWKRFYTFVFVKWLRIFKRFLTPNVCESQKCQWGHSHKNNRPSLWKCFFSMISELSTCAHIFRPFTAFENSFIVCILQLWGHTFCLFSTWCKQNPSVKCQICLWIITNQSVALPVSRIINVNIIFIFACIKH